MASSLTPKRQTLFKPAGSPLTPSSSALHLSAAGPSPGDDRIVLDLGARFLKVGFSGEPRPRHIIPVELPLVSLSSAAAPASASNTAVRHGGVGEACGEGCRLRSAPAELYGLDIAKQDMPLLEATLTRLLQDVFSNYLHAEPRETRVIICESPLMPLPWKRVICKVMFERLQVPSVTFANMHMLGMLTTGTDAGMVVDCGHLETCVLPVFDNRPLLPFVTTTPRAGLALTKHLSDLLSAETGVQLSRQTLEDILFRFTFVDPKIVSATPPKSATNDTAISVDGDGLDPNIKTERLRRLKDRYMRESAGKTAPDVPCAMCDEWDGRDDKFVVPGWIRQRAAEILFADDDDARGIGQCILDGFLKLNPDIRGVLASQILLTGGLPHLPGFRTRLRRQLRCIVETDPRYRSLKGLLPSFAFMDEVAPPAGSGNPNDDAGRGQKQAGSGGDAVKSNKPSGSAVVEVARPPRGAAFRPNVRVWVGGSLFGSMLSAARILGPELKQEEYLAASADDLVSLMQDWTAFTDAGADPADAVEGGVEAEKRFA